MRIQIGSLAILLLFVSGCFIGKPGSGISKTESRDVDDFHRVSLQGSGEVNIKVGGPKSVTITLDDNLIDMVKTEVRDGKLVIDVDGSYSSRIGLKVEIVTPELDGFYCSGSGDSKIEDVDAKTFDAHISGSGSIEVDGIAETVNVSIAGSGDMDLSKLSAAQADVSISGSGEISVHASQRVTATIAGSGDVDVYGNPPEIAKSISGSGEVTKKKAL